MDCVVIAMYYKIIQNGYIKMVGSGSLGNEITEDEYNAILKIISNKPTAPHGYGYKLTDSLEWELYELPPTETEELTETEQKAMGYDIIMGVAE